MSTLIGHQARWAALARAFANGKIPQTLLLTGPPEIGKWTIARRYAQLLLCPSPVEAKGLPAPCGTCRVCHQVEIETFPDFKVYRPLVSSAEEEHDWVIAPKMMSGSILPIAVARRFGDEAMRKPLAGQRKMMVIVQADRMNDEAQNALLKTFEEPVPGLSIWLLCENADSLRPTIRSRCWQMPLSLVGDAEIAAWLRESTPASGTDVSEADISAAVKAAAGRPGSAWREIERLHNAAEGESTPRFDQAQTFVARLLQSRPVAALALTEEGLSLAKSWWDEDQSLLAAAGKESKKGDAKIVRSSVARFLDELGKVYHLQWTESLQSKSTDAARWSSGLDLIRKTRHYILHNANTNLALDVLFGRLIAGT